MTAAKDEKADAKSDESKAEFERWDPLKESRRQYIMRRRCANRKGWTPTYQKFTPQIREQIIALVESGAFFEEAAAIVGVTSRTVREWRSRGRDNLEAIHDYEERELAGEVDEDEKMPKLDMFGAFELNISCARALANFDDLERIRAAPDWRAVAWVLERRDNKRFGSGSQRLDLPGEGEIDDVAEAETIFFERIDRIRGVLKRVRDGEE